MSAEKAAARTADLADYGVNQTMIARLAAADHVLKTRMDELVPVIAVEHSEFAVDYANARVIEDSG